MRNTNDWLALRSTDLKAALRLAGELRDFVTGSELQKRHFLMGLGSLVGASVTIWVELRGIAAGSPVIAGTLDQGWSDEGRRVHLCDYLAAQTEAPDPTIATMLGQLQLGEVVARRRRELADDDVWYRSVHFQKYRRAAGLDDCIYSTLLQCAGLQTFSLHRAANDRRFSDSERALVGALHSACSPLLDDAESRLAERLSPRLRATLDGLLSGLGEKEIACELELSPHTVHGYVKTLYRRLGVSSRLELASRYGQMSPPGRRRRPRP